MITKVSIIVPCYNQSTYLDDALNSVLNQSYQDWECIIVNDGSVDETESIAKKLIKKDGRFKLVSQANAGLSAARNRGIQEAKGTYILPLDADDMIAPHYIDYAVKEFKRDKNLKLVYSKAEKFGVVNKEWDLPAYSLQTLKKNNIIFCSAVFKKNDWLRFGGYDEKLRNGWEDWDFWLSLLKDGGKVNKLDYLGFFYRVKSESMISKMDEEVQNKTFAYINNKHIDFYQKIYPDFGSMKRDLSHKKPESFMVRLKNFFK